MNTGVQNSTARSPISKPTMWVSALLKDVAYFSSGTTPSRARHGDFYESGTNPWVKTLDLNNSIIVRTDECVTDKALSETSLKIQPSGSVLIAMYGGFQQIGRTGQLAMPAAVNQAITVIVPIKSKLLPSYLLHVFNYQVGYWRNIASSSRKDPNITSNDVKNFPIMLPSIVEQHAISEVLSDSGRVITQLERLITKKQAIKQGMMQQLLTGKTRLPGFSGPWNEMRLGDVGSCLRGVSYDPQSDLSLADRKYTVRLLRSNNVQGGRVVLNDLQYVHERRVDPRQFLRGGDIVLCMANGSRALVGKSAYFGRPEGEARYTFGAFMGVYRSHDHEVHARFVAQLLQGKEFRDWLDLILAGSSINNLKPGDVDSFEVSVPSLAEQRAIAVVLQDGDKEIELLRARLVKARMIKQGMMQELLTGRTRLPVKEPVS